MKAKTLFFSLQMMLEPSFDGDNGRTGDVAQSGRSNIYRSRLYRTPILQSLSRLGGQAIVGDEIRQHTGRHSAAKHICTTSIVKHEVHSKSAMPHITKYWLQVSALVAFVFFVITAFVPFIGRVQITVLPLKAPDKGSFQASKHNVWQDLSKDEAQELTKFLFEKSELNLTEASNATRYATLS